MASCTPKSLSSASSVDSCPRRGDGYEQRSALRDRWQRFQALPPQQQEAVRQNFHRFQQLPPEQRQQLRQQWRNATPEQRQQMIEHARAQRQKHMMQPHAAHPPPKRP